MFLILPPFRCYLQIILDHSDITALVCIQQHMIAMEFHHSFYVNSSSYYTSCGRIISWWCQSQRMSNTCVMVVWLQIKFEEGIISTPKLTDSIEVPESVDVLGQTIDLTPIQGLLRPLQDAAMSVARTISGQPPLKFSIQGNRAESWLLTTFLDEDLRISRGDGGSVFVLVREASPWLY
jgi:hypothetical protein